VGAGEWGCQIDKREGEVKKINLVRYSCPNGDGGAMAFTSKETLTCFICGTSYPANTVEVSIAPEIGEA